MKKLVYAAAFLAAFTFASCGGNKTSDAAAADSTAEAVDTAVSDMTIENPADAEKLADSFTAKLDEELQSANPDPAKVKMFVENIRQASESLKGDGNEEIAAAYASKVKAYLEKNADKIKNVDPQSITVLDVVSAAANLPQSVKDAAQEGVDAVVGDGAAAKAAGQAAKAAAEQAGQKAVSDAKAAGQKAVSDAKSAAKAKADAAVQNANDKANAAVQKGAAKASDAISKGLKKALGE